MRRSPTIATCAVALALSTAIPVTAPTNPPPPYWVSGGIWSTPVDGNLHLHIEFMDWWQAPGVAWLETPAALDLYRRLVGVQCSDFERLNTEPFPFSWLGGWYNPLDLDFVDTTTKVGHVYQYMIRAVDANRDPVAANPDVLVGYVTNGEALIGHGTIVSSNRCGYPAPDLVHRPCPEECFPWLSCGPESDLLPLVDTGQTVRLYGRIETGYHCEFGFDDYADVTRAEPSTCIVAVEAMTWGEVKRIYR